MTAVSATPQRGVLFGGEAAVESRDGDCAQKLELALGASQWGERVQPDRAAGAQLDDGAAQGVGERCVFALDVDDARDAAEDVLAVDQRLDQAGLGRPDVSDDHHVGISELAAVELPGVIDERPAVQVAPDVDAAGPEAAFGYEGVGGLQVRARDAVAGTLRWHPARACARKDRRLDQPPQGLSCRATWLHESPRHSGRPKVKA